MANPRQRRKARSSSYKPVSQSKHAKRNLKKTPPIRGPKALQQAWDKQKTAKQNYARLGLIHDLNPSAPGGSEKAMGPRHEEKVAEAPQAQASSHSTKTTVPSGYGRIIRDASGKVTGIELSENDDATEAVEDEATMEDMEAEIDENVLDKWATNLGQKNNDAGDKSAGLLEELQRIAMVKHMDSSTMAVAQSSTGPNVRHAAPGEMGYLARLVDKHGKDLEAMAKDGRLNPDQRTEGQLRRALRTAGFPSG